MLKLSIPETLPIHDAQQELITAIQRHQVLIVAGETGSGKTTQLAKLCLQAGIEGRIAHTQPRRMAARSVAARIAEEAGCTLGQGIGYRVRFQQRSRGEDRITLMTDGILLNEIHHDRLLRRYQAIIIDEAHERSLNIDFLLGYLKRILPKRPDLRLIITSATINTGAFCRFFDDAPLLTISGRCYPVEVRYRPWKEDGESDLSQAIIDAVDEAGRLDPFGDILVFLPGEREIREASHALAQHGLRHTELLPLYARLASHEQDRVFAAHTGRRIVLATNIAETSLTVPGIRFVIDSGLARISRYSPRHRVQRLPVERIARSSADQRAGRCGRVAEGICFRLYSEDDYLGRPAHTEPEIRRTHLASVLLRMADMQLGALQDFPLTDAPEMRAIRDGQQLLQELQALDAEGQITPLGTRMARLPLDPRFSRMLLAAQDSGCLLPVLVIVCALSIPDPRLRPAEEQEKADQCHRQWQDTASDFASWLRLWQWYIEAERHHSRSKLRKLCKQHYLSWLRMREWQDLQLQVAQALGQPGLDSRHLPEMDNDAIHRAMLSGLLTQVGQKQEDGSYLGARGGRFAIMPGSAMRKKPTDWVMAAEWLELRQRYGVCLAPIEPAWLEDVGAHLLARSYGEPYWSKRRGRVLAREQRSLFGLPLGAQAVNWHPHDADACREIFIRQALVGMQLQGRAPQLRQFVAALRQLHAAIDQYIGKSRRLYREDVEERLCEWLSSHLPEGIHDQRTLERWLKRAAIALPPLSALFPDGADVDHDFPDALMLGRHRLRIRYRFDPRHAEDGMSLHIPQSLLAELPAERPAWLVPGLLLEKLILLFRKLPAPQRRALVPIPDFAAACLAALPFGEGDFHAALSREVQRMAGLTIPPEQWREQVLPAHLRMHLCVLDEQGKVIEKSDDLYSLRHQHASERTPSLTVGESSRQWTFGTLQPSLQQRIQGRMVTLYPALQAQADGVCLQLCDSEASAREMHRQGLIQLFALQLKQQCQWIARKLPGQRELLLLASQLQEHEPLPEQITHACIEHVFLQAPWPQDKQSFEARLAEGRAELIPCAEALAEAMLQSLQAMQAIRQQLPAQSKQKQAIGEQILSTLGRLFAPGFLRQTPMPRLLRYPVYLQSALNRLQQGPRRFARDQQDFDAWQQLWQAQQTHLKRYPEAASRPGMQGFRWLLEELQVALFSPELKTSEPVSCKRLQQRWQQLLSGECL